MDPIYEDFELDNTWRVKFTPENENEDGYPMIVRIDVAKADHRRQTHQLEFSGQVKWDGCSDWGFGERVLIHFCGDKDLTLMRLIYRKAEEMIGGFR